MTGHNDKGEEEDIMYDIQQNLSLELTLYSIN